MNKEKGAKEFDLVYNAKEFRCSDARDRGVMDAHASETVKHWLLERGVLLLRDTVVKAGVFATKDVIHNIRKSIHEGVDSALAAFGGDLRLPNESRLGSDAEIVTVVQANTHADVSTKKGVEKGETTYMREELSFVEGSPINCGMEKAGLVWNELREWLRIEGIAGSEGELVELLQGRYGLESGYSEHFITSIPANDYPGHILTQRAKLEKALRSDFELQSLDIKVNAGITNYRTGEVLRVDDNDDFYTPLDDIASLTSHLIAMVPEDHPEKALRADKQMHVKAVLVNSPSIDHPRNTLISYLQEKVEKKISTAGAIFTVNGHDVTDFTYCYGPYSVLSFYYAAEHLKARDMYVLGKNDAEVVRMLTKIEKDPIVSGIVKKYGVNVKGLTLDEVIDRVGRLRTPETDSQLKEIITEGVKTFKPSRKSLLNREVKRPSTAPQPMRR